jgi:hypothetical protein
VIGEGPGDGGSVATPPAGADPEAGRWVAPNELDDLPLSVVDRTALALLREAGLLASTP